MFTTQAASLCWRNTRPPKSSTGAGGIAFHDGKFLVVGGLPQGIMENYAYEYDGDFKFVKKHVLDSGFTLMGIQTTAFANDHWWFTCKPGSPQRPRQS